MSIRLLLFTLLSLFKVSVPVQTHAAFPIQKKTEHINNTKQVLPEHSEDKKHIRIELLLACLLGVVGANNFYNKKYWAGGAKLGLTLLGIVILALASGAVGLAGVVLLVLGIIPLLITIIWTGIEIIEILSRLWKRQKA